MEAAKPYRSVYTGALWLVPVLLGTILWLYYMLPAGQDWMEFFRPATLAMLHGESPYSIKNFHNAPWTLLPFFPLAVLPHRLGRLGLFLFGFSSFVYIAFKLKAKPPSLLLFLTSFPVVACLYGGGLDWMPMLSFVTPAPVSLLFAAMKPQVGIGIGFFWLIDAWLEGGIKRVARDFLPIVILLLLSFAHYGFWIGTSLGKWDSPVNAAFFPYLIPIGLYLLYTRQKPAAMASCICLSPYYTFFGLSAPLVVLFQHPRLMLIGWIVLWIYPLSRILLL